MARLLIPAALAFLIFSLVSAQSGPPGASVSVQLQVPAALRTGNFEQDRFLNVPPGFQISLFASVPGARFLAVAPNGDVLVSNPGAGKITLLRPDPAGGVPVSFDFATDLKLPHDIVFDTINGTTYVYVSESNQVDRFLYQPGDAVARGRQIVVTGLPDSSLPELHGSYAHGLKNIAIDSDHKLYVSIASACNACLEDTVSNPVRGAIYQYNADGSGQRLFARGLRNAEGLDFLPGTKTLWVTVNGRDETYYPVRDNTGYYGQLVPSYVDNHPPDLFTSVRDGGNYGWPFCNPNPDTPAGVDQMPFDLDYELNTDGQVNCATMDKSSKGIQAHSAPLGMRFLQNTAFPAAYRSGGVAALHGSWNRTVKTGYKVIYFPFDPVTQTPGPQIDLVSGWVDGNTQEVWGRPVDVAVDPNGSLLISDDSAGAIYKLIYTPAGISTASGYTILAPESLASTYGSNFAGGSAAATSLPLPTTLGGLSLEVMDSAGVSRSAPLLYVSANQINYQVPAGTAVGDATITVQTKYGTISPGKVQIAAVAPGLYTADRSGTGVAAATAVRRIAGSDVSGDVPVFTCDASGANCTAVPIDVGVDAPVYLTLYGTGIRNRSSLDNVSVTIGGVKVPVLYAGPQGAYPGLDQVNVALVLELRGKGEVDVVLTVDGQTANPVRIAIQ